TGAPFPPQMRVECKKEACHDENIPQASVLCHGHRRLAARERRRNELGLAHHLLRSSWQQLKLKREQTSHSAPNGNQNTGFASPCPLRGGVRYRPHFCCGRACASSGAC